MPTRRTSTPRSSSATHRTTHAASATPRRPKSGLRHIATMLPLAVGLASTSPLLNPTANPPATTQIQATKGTFRPVCTLPFPGVINPDSDNHCGISGGSSDPAKQAESESKNNFCSETSSPEVFSYDQLISLQQKATDAKLKKSITDRKVVQDMGEGTYVSYIAFVKDAHYSDVSAGEAVNCNIPGNTTNDIHIVLLQKPNDDECNSTTAEMSPHFRPASWTPDNIMKASAGHPVRVTGHLFYDGSHSPCTASSRPNPKRKSLWEVHPVYKFEICSQDSIAACQASNVEWTPLEKMFTSEEE